MISKFIKFVGGASATLLAAALAFVLAGNSDDDRLARARAERRLRHLLAAPIRFARQLIEPQEFVLQHDASIDPFDGPNLHPHRSRSVAPFSQQGMDDELSGVGSEN